MNVENSTQNPTEEITTIAKGAGVFFIGTAAGTGLKYLFELIVARSLGTGFFGLFIIGFSLFKILEIISTLGLHNGILRYGALFKGKGDIQRIKGAIISALKIALAASILISVISISLSKFVAVNIFQKIELSPVIVLFSLALPFSVIGMILVFASQSFKIVKHRVYVKEIFEPLSKIILFLLLFLIGWRLYGALIAFLVSCVSGSFLAFQFFKKEFPQITDSQFRPIFDARNLLSFSWPLFFTGLLNRTFLWMSTLILGSFLHQKEAGIFGASQRTAILGIMVLTSFSAIFAPIIADLYNKKEMKKLESLFKTVTKWIFTISFPLFLIMIFYGRNILNIFGTDFIIGEKCLIILAIGQLISSLGGSYGYMIMMSGRSKIIMMNAAIVSFTNIVLCFVLIPKYGIMGAAYAATISIVLITLIGLVEVYSIYKIQPYRLDFLKPIFSGLFSISFTYLILRSFFKCENLFVVLIIGMTSFLVIYTAILFFLGIGEEDKIILDRIKSKLAGRR